MPSTSAPTPAGATPSNTPPDPPAANTGGAAWRRHADAIVRAYQAGRTISRIEADYGIWDSDLYRLLDERGIPSRRAARRTGHPPLPPAAEIARQYHGTRHQPGTTAAELARRYGVSRGTITNRLLQAEAARRDPSQTALLYHRADWHHLTDEILAALRTGKTVARIRAAFPISHRQLRRLRAEHGLARPLTAPPGRNRT